MLLIKDVKSFTGFVDPSCFIFVDFVLERAQERAQDGPKRFRSPTWFQLGSAWGHVGAILDNFLVLFSLLNLRSF